MPELSDMVVNRPREAATVSLGLSPRERLRRLVVGILTAKSSPTSFSDEDVLAEIGVASVDMVTLLLAIEGEFDIEVPAHEITADVFRSISTVDALIRRLLPHLAPA